MYNYCDPVNDSYCISFEFNDNLKELNEKEKIEFYKEFNSILKNYEFKFYLLENIVFNNSTDATKAFKCINLGFSNSWVKLFILKMNVFKIQKNSNIEDLLELNKDVIKPNWLKI